MPYNALAHYDQTLNRTASYDFWRQQCAGAQFKDLFPIPAGTTTPPAATSSATKEVSLKAPSGLDVPGISIVYAAWALVLSDHASALDISFSTIHANRDIPIPGIEDFIGQTIAISPLRVSLQNQDRTVHAFLTGVAADILATGKHRLHDFTAFDNVSSKAAAQRQYAIAMDFLPLPEQFDDELLFQNPREVYYMRNGVEIPFFIMGHLRPTNVSMTVAWDESYFGNIGDILIERFDNVVRQLGEAGEGTKLSEIVIRTKVAD